MTISLCIIVKNNESTLERCLNSVKELVDEIIIVDTGSTDKTKEIALKYTDKIFDYIPENTEEWINNFSAAKNFAISKATKEWILALDADETLSKQDFPKILELTKQTDYLGFALIQRNYDNKIGSFNWISCKNDSYEESKIANGYVPRRMIRFFKNIPEIKFEGVIHDSVEKSILNLGKIKETNIPFHHYGLLNRSPERTKFYIEIEKKNLRDDFFQDYQIASQLHAINELDESLEFLNKSIEKNSLFALSWLELGMIQIKQNKLQDAKQSLHKAESLEEHPMTYDHLGILYGQLGETEKAINYFQKAIKLNPQNADFHFNLGLTYDSIGMKKEASIEFQNAVYLNKAYEKIISFN
ncbi:MAG: glycosyltransferase [Nanoarchaeota archaeon]|nr:glycosyltransferase [Nanoarchaeota archaeon]